MVEAMEERDSEQMRLCQAEEQKRSHRLSTVPTILSAAEQAEVVEAGQLLLLEAVEEG